MRLTYTKPERIILKGHPELNERWVQDKIAEDTSLLGLGDLILKDKERAHPSAGRLDLLCQHVEENRRYEIEVQLGKTDESHIIRTIEYWDIERKRYPQYEHTAVLVAEEITSRFLNVVALFNGVIPLIAIQMQALRIGEQLSLVFTTVLNEVRLGLVDEDEESLEITDRNYWETRASRATLQITDALLRIVNECAPDLRLNYNKFYIGLATKDDEPNNFILFRPKKEWVRFEVRLERSDEVQRELEAAGIDVMEYDIRSGRYRIRLTEADIDAHATLFSKLIAMAWRQAA